VNRAVTDDLDDNGYLMDPQGLVAAGIIAPKITVKFAIANFTAVRGWCVPRLSDPGLPLRMRLISVNGKQYTLGNISIGEIRYDHTITTNNYYTITYEIPIEMVKFPRRTNVGGGGSPIPSLNFLELTDTKLGLATMYPGRHVPWSMAAVRAMAPIMLVHGTNSDPSTWSAPPGDSFNDYFSTFKGIFFNDITLLANGSIERNGTDLETQITQRLASVGAKQCHIIAHSKGGLDSRSMISKHYGSGRNSALDQPGNFEVLSLYTLDTPHRGTVLSDISWNTQNNPDLRADPNWYDLRNLMSYDFRFLHDPPSGNVDGQTHLLLGVGVGAPGGHALEAQMTQNMRTWNFRNHFNFNNQNTGGTPIKFYNTAVDSDWNVRDGKMDSTERADSGIPFIVATSMYRMLYWATQVTTRPSIRTIPLNEGATNIEIPVTELFVPDDQRGAQWNSMIVSIGSAFYDGGIAFCPNNINAYNGGIVLSNHSRVKTRGMASGVVNNIRSDFLIH
jgi:hypothetical protein